MKKRMLKISISAVTIIILLILINRFWCSTSGIPPELVSVDEIKIEQFNADSINLNVFVIVLNRNNFKVDVSDFYANILHYQDTIGFAKKNEMIQLNALDSAAVNFYASLNTKKFIKSVSDKDDSLNLRMIGTANADLGLFTLPVVIDLEYSFNAKENISQLVERDVQIEKLIKLKGGKLKSLSTSESVVEVEFKVRNPYGVDFIVEGYPSKIYINDKEAGSGNIKTAINIKKKGGGIKAVSVYKLDNIKTITSLFGSIFTRKLIYKTTGVLLIDILGYRIQFPYSFNGELIKI
jgi:LEA14-like dessication related protein